IPGHVPAFEEVEPDVKTAWKAAQHAEAWSKAYEKMRARYQLVLPAPPVGNAPGDDGAPSDGAPENAEPWGGSASPSASWRSRRWPTPTRFAPRTSRSTRSGPVATPLRGAPRCFRGCVCRSC